MITNDTNFLNQLFNKKEREIFVRLTALSWEEKPIEYIEGRATGGSINIDGTSVLRRTCSITLVAQELNINDFYWGKKSKFKLEIGLKNVINSKYPDIIWFKQGLYIITSFSTSQTTNNYTINISGKDKMCLLNGDLAGTLPHTTDFGIEEYYDEATNTTTYTSVPIRRIIQESVQNFGNELSQNIIINDLEDAGLELLEYRGDVPLFLFREVNSDSFINMTVNQTQGCYILKDGNWTKTNINDKDNIRYDNLVNLTEGDKPTHIKLTLSGKEYTIAKFEYGSIPGYRLTDLVFAGDLISNVGETLTSMLDKIKDMLGEFEYFYNLDGKFVFQKKQTYVDVAWNDIEKGDEIYANAAVNKSIPIWNFTGNQLITAVQNTPNILNLRNDFAVWGKKKTTSGTELDIHMRYAIDTKPIRYYSLIDDKWYYTYGDECVDWRELIYKMALDYRRFYHDDDFISRIIEKNTPEGEVSLFPTGRTGYEQYYVDVEGFWRQLYNPKPQAKKFKEVEPIDINSKPSEAYIKNGLIRGTKEVLNKTAPEDVYVIQDGQLKPFIQGYCHLNENENYYFKDTNGGLSRVSGSDKGRLNKLSLSIFYIENVQELYDSLKRRLQTIDGNLLQVYKYNNGAIVKDCIRFIDAKYQEALNANVPLYIFSSGYEPYAKLDESIKLIYNDSGYRFNTKFSYHQYDNYGSVAKENAYSKNINYYTAYYEFNDSGWAKEVVDNPENLLFWFDFLEADGADLGKYSTKTIGVRSKALNDTNVKSIYYREIPKTIFQSGQETYEHQPGYTYVQLQGTMENLFTISSKGKSAQEKIEELLYQYSYCIESTTLTTLPIYHLEPNTRIQVRDQKSNIDGEYAVSKITIPLTYNGTMSITATKVVSNIS